LFDNNTGKRIATVTGILNQQGILAGGIDGGLQGLAATVNIATWCSPGVLEFGTLAAVAGPGDR
jgi:hypothetical protein